MVDLCLLSRITMLRALLFLSCLAIVHALDIHGKVAWNDACPDIKSLGHSKAVLDDGRMSGSVAHTGDFVIPSVPPGTYLLSIISHDYTFDQVRIDVFNSTPEARPHVPGTPFNPPSTVLLPYPIVLVPRQKLLYFVPPESFNLIAMLSNPMMLMMVFGGGMMLAMPYLVKNLDPESLKEFKEQQAKFAGVQNAMASGDLKSGLTALMAGDEEVQSTQPAPPTSNKPAGSNKGRSSKKGKR